MGRAVIGGIIASTFATLTILPLVFTWIQGNASMAPPSLDPEDPESSHFDANLRTDDIDFSVNPHLHQPGRHSQDFNEN